MLAAAPSRKRRRQNWHNKRNLKKKQGIDQPHQALRRTKDQGAWERAPPKARRQIFIEQKLKVVQTYRKLAKKRDEAHETVHKRMPAGLKTEDKKAFLEAREQAKKVCRLNLETLCAQEHPDLVNKGNVWKWVKQADAEGWDSIPATDRVRWTEIPNSWRQKMNLPKKGRAIGGAVPALIQAELDRLVLEHSMGASDVTERKEVVSVAHIATWFDVT